MKISSLAALSSIAIALNCNAALITGLDYRVSTNVELLGTDVQTYSHPSDPPPFPTPFESKQTLDFDNDKDGVITSTATELTLTTPGGAGTFTYTGTNTNSVFVNDETNGVNSMRTKLNAAGVSISTIKFTLETGDVMQAKLAMIYSITIDNDNQNSANIFWQLKDPNDVVLIGNTVTEQGGAAALNSQSVDDSIIISVVGAYTFTFGAEVTEQEFANNKKSINANIENFSFEVTSIPEPSSAALLLLTGSALLLRRKR